MKFAFVKTFVLGLLLVLVTAHFPPAGHAEEVAPLAIRSVGLYDEDGTILYSVIIASDQEVTVTDLTITSVLPSETRFLGVEDTPDGAQFMGENYGIVTWQLAEVAADSIIGPFTYRVAVQEGVEVPSAPAAEVRWKGVAPGKLQAMVAQEKLQKLAPQGAVELGPLGTRDDSGANVPVPLGETGIMVFVPQGAISQTVTLSLTRLTPAPEVLPSEATFAAAGETWWCALLAVELEPATTLSPELPIVLLIPSRKTITPGQAVQIFVEDNIGAAEIEGQTHDGWRPLFPPATSSLSQPAAFVDWYIQAVPDELAIVAPGGNYLLVSSTALWNVSGPFRVGLGVADPPFRTITSKDLTTTISDGTSNITDGTSNTKRYIEQDNLFTLAQ